MHWPTPASVKKTLPMMKSHTATGPYESHAACGKKSTDATRKSTQPSIAAFERSTASPASTGLDSCSRRQTRR